MSRRPPAFARFASYGAQADSHRGKTLAAGRELFFRNGRQMMFVAVQPGQTFQVGPPQLLFEGNYVQELDNSGATNYDVSRDGQRFLMVAPAAAESAEQVRQKIVVVQNWTEELKRPVSTR